MSPNLPRILIVDDEPRNLALVCACLNPENRPAQFLLETATSGQGALEQAANFHPDLILLDIMMQNMDGLEAARRFKSQSATAGVPIIMTTALEDRDARIRALDAGAEEFLSKPLDYVEMRVRVQNLLKLRHYTKLVAEQNQQLEKQVLAKTAQLMRSYRETIMALTRAASYRDEETGAHIVRISYYCQLLAQAFGLDAEFCDCIFYASPLHDVGKIAIPDSILFKPGRLSVEEWVIMKSHAARGADMLHGANSPYISMAREIARCHHECWDGSGYPVGLAGEEIPLSARLMQIADVYDALRSKRPYKPAYSHEEAAHVICVGDERTRPGQFDPAVLAAFSTLSDRFAEIFSQHAHCLSESGEIADGTHIDSGR